MKRSLRISILVFVAIGLVLPATLSLAVLYTGSREETQRRIRLQLDQYTDILAFGAREPLWNLNSDAMRPLIEAVLNNPDVVQVSVADRTAGPLISIDRSESAGEVVRAMRKVVYKDRELGSVTVGITGTTLRAEQTRQMLTFTATLVVQLGLAAALIFILLRRRLVRPLETLGEAADALARGDLSKEVPSLGDNEIGWLGQRLETTRRELLGLFDNLADKNTALAHELRERERADKARRDSEDRLETVFALSAEPMGVLRRRDGMFLLANPAWETIFGYRNQDSVGRVAADMQLWADEASRTRCLELLDREGRLDSVEVRMQRRDGSILLMQASARTFEDKGELCVVWSLRDITAARLSENALRESEQRFASLFQHAPVALCIVDVEEGARILDVNSQFENDLGRTRAGCIGNTLEALGLWANAEDAGLFQTLLDGQINEKISAWTRNPDGALACRDIAGRHMLLRDRHCFVWSAIDVTPIIQAKQDVEQANRSLEGKVALRTRALEQSNHELESLIEQLRVAQVQLVQSEKLAALGALVAGISHELNTPIGNCLMVASTLDDQRHDFVRALETGLRRSTLTEFLSALDDGNQTLLRNLQRAADLVSSFKQVAVDQTSSQRREFDLREIVREIEITLAPTLRKAQTRFVNEVPDGLIFDSYPGPLGQVITNLTNNAITHGFDGREGGVITLRAEIADAQQIRFTIHDDGKGIPVESLPRIFDPFFTTKLGRGGSGLGLHIVYNIVTGVLGGRISVESQPGEGTRFQIVLPRSAPLGSEPDSGPA